MDWRRLAGQRIHIPGEGLEVKAWRVEGWFSWWLNELFLVLENSSSFDMMAAESYKNLFTCFSKVLET